MKFSLIAALMLLLYFNYATELSAYQYYPNFIGNTWTLRNRDNGEEKIVKIAKTTVIHNQTVNLLERRTPTAVDEMYIFTEPDGIKLVRSLVHVGGLELSLDYNPPEMFVPDSLEVGTNWEIRGQTTVFIFITVKVIVRATVVAQEDVTTPVGTFRNCFKIKQKYDAQGLNISLETYMWLAPNIGLVKEMDSSQRISELVNYKLFYPWDINGDLKVDLLDLAVVESNFGEYSYNPKMYNPDTNRDGIVDISDLVLVGKHHGEMYLPDVVLQNRSSHEELRVKVFK